MSKVINRPRVSLQVRVRSRPNQCEICSADNIRKTGFSSNISVFPCQYYFTKGSYSFSSQYYSTRAAEGKAAEGSEP